MLLTDRYRRQAHNAAWYDSPSDTPSNLPIALPNPFGKRRAPSRNSNPLHLQEAAVPNVSDGRSLRPIRTDGQDYRPTTPLDRQLELGLGERKPHSATTPNVDTHQDPRHEDFNLPRSESPVNGEYPTDKVDRVEEQRVHDSNSTDTAVEAGNKSPIDVNNEGAHQRKKGAMAKMAGLFHKKSADETDGDTDDNNGKNKQKQVFTPMSQVRATILNSWINVLLIACK